MGAPYNERKNMQKHYGVVVMQRMLHDDLLVLGPETTDVLADQAPSCEIRKQERDKYDQRIEQREYQKMLQRGVQIQQEILEDNERARQADPALMNAVNGLDDLNIAPIN